jgi:LSU ribosomal protein L32P
MAVPKSKISNSRRGMRRSHLRFKGKNFIEDKESGERRLPHHVDMIQAHITEKKSSALKLKNNF